MHMMKLCALLIALCVAGLVKASPADNEPHYYVGQDIAVSQTVVCDTQEQIDSIASAQQQSWPAALASYRNWYLTRNHLNQPSCYAMSGGQWIQAVLVAQINVYDHAHMGNGDVTTLYSLAVLWTDREGNTHEGYIISIYPLHDEPTADQLKPSVFEMDT